MNPVAPTLASSLGSAGRAFVRRRAAQVFLGKPVSASALAANIAFGAAVLGAKHIELTHNGPWQFVASDFDWLRPPDGEQASVARLFERITPFPQQGPGSHRNEIYVAAFARHAYVARGGEVLWVVGGDGIGRVGGDALSDGGGESGLPHMGHVPPWCGHVLAFSFE